MNGWAFAAVGLGVVLVFEFVLFRYFTPDRPSSSRFEGAGGPSDAGGATGPDRSRERSSASGAASGDTLACHNCGTRNVDTPAVVFCRSCLGRLP